MTDDTVREALRSDAPLVVVEAPAGCGKTHQGADYASEMAASNRSRLLILTHTHAACSMFSERARGVGSRLEIRTIDSVIAQIAGAYHAGLGIPADTATWIRQQKNGHAMLAVKVAALLERYPMIAASLARRYPIVICDEHQDSSGDQHSVGMALLSQGAKLRIFADPMQEIFKDVDVEGARPSYGWDELKEKAHRFERLDVPHRWSKGCPQLGQWTLKAREALRSGGKVDLKNALPPSVSFVVAENLAEKHLDYRLSSMHRKPIDGFENGQSSLLILTPYNDTARSFRSFFNRRIPLWEGHTRSGLEKLVDAVDGSKGDCGALAAAVVRFIDEIGIGFSPSAFGNRFEHEAREGCTKKCRGKPATIQDLARHLVLEPNHRGIAKMLRRVWELKNGDAAFADIELDCQKEFWDAVSLGDFDTTEAGLAEITYRRTYSRPKPPAKAISIIHKAKGLECESVIVMPCDATTFPEKWEARCLLYVAISRAKGRLMLVVSRNKPSPLLEL